jgi:hypothetical protein
MANVVVSAIATFNGKALKKGQKDISAFDKQAQKLGRTFSRVFAATALVAFSKKAINAFAADEKAAKSLAVQLENTGNAFRVNEVESYIAGLQSLYGVLDDQLRPAFQTLLNATGSVTLSQQALETALNVSAGTGKDLATVVAAIAKGASGTTTSIARLGTGLDKATIATGDMNKIMAALDAKFKGQALARLQTYAGKMDLLKTSAASATEIIGKGLIDALSALAKDNSIDEATSSMNSFALATADTVKGLGLLVAEVKKFADSDIGKLLAALAFLAFGSKKLIIGGALALIGYDIGKSNPTAKPNVGGYSSIPLQRAETKAIKDSVFYRKQENAALKAKTEIDKLKDKFDLERIGLTVALNAATDEETKLRLRSQLAILDNNEALAKKLLAEMNGVKATEELTKALYSVAGAAMDSALKFRQINPFAGTMYGETGRTMSSTPSLSTLPGGLPPAVTNPLAGTYYGETGRDLPSNLRITVDTASTGDKFAQLIAESLQVAGRSGYSSVPNGSLPV